MDWTTLISVIGIIGTWVTIVLVYFTLREMRNQRKASQKPDLIIPKAKIYGYVYGYKEMTHLLIPRYWSNDKDVTDKGRNWGESGLITLYNVGFGVAKNIRLEWDGFYDKTIQQIKDYCYQQSIPIIIQEGEEGFTIIETNHAPEEVFLLSPLMSKHDFLMPASIISEGLLSYFPGAFKELVSILVYLKSHHRRQHLNDLSELEINFPIMYLELHYEDLENSQYTKTFEIEFSISSYTTVGDAKDVVGMKQLMSGSFEFKSKPESDKT